MYTCKCFIFVIQATVCGIGIAVIPRSTNIKHMRDNLNTGRIYPPLSDPDMKLLSSISNYISTPVTVSI